MKTLNATDLFAGGGGASGALAEECEAAGIGLELTAINHWDVAVQTHAANLPRARHLCEPVDAVNPRDLYRGRRLHLLVAGPECVFFSQARGGKPCDEQRRASAWCVHRWADALQPEFILVENVKEFQSWGPLGTNGRPLKRRRGETFQAWLAAIRSLGYTVDHRVLCAADYGDATTRERLFVMARKGRKPLPWPEPTHARHGGTPELFGTLRPWRPARDVIEWAVKGKSIFGRKRPLAANTLKRIAAGLRKFGGESFLVPTNFGERAGQLPRVHDVAQPLPTITGSGNHALLQPFVLGQQSGAMGRGVDEPLPTVAARGAISLVEPFLLQMSQTGSNGDRSRPASRPLPTITSADDLALVEPFVVNLKGTGADQLPSTARPIGSPLGTITGGGNNYGLAEPFLVKFYGTGGAVPVTEPLDTVTSRDRFGLVEVSPGVHLDVLFRMLLPLELQRAMSFPDGWVWKGTREDVVRMIGNAWPGQTGRALFRSILREIAA